MSDVYENPLTSRYASPEMLHIMSSDYKFGVWRHLWLALAESQAELGQPITQAQLAQMSKHLDDIDYPRVAEYEKQFRHDVMAHIHAFGDVAPLARAVIHLGATSAYVGDNTDLIQMRAALQLLCGRVYHLLDVLARFARKHRKLPTLGYTHFQPAQLTTVGKRASLWTYDVILDAEQLLHTLDHLVFRGVKGTTGTQASFLKLFDGDHRKVQRLEKLVARKMGFNQVAPVTGQTYNRKVDATVLSVLGGLAQSVHKCCNDIRLLAHLKQIEEPFESTQVGSSAMAYKRNPMRCERATSLARFIMGLIDVPAMTAAEQWFERTLDDSAAKRLAVPQAFLAADAILTIRTNVIQGLVVDPRVIAAAVQSELPFMATENILMAAVAAGGDRQHLHELIRRHSHAAAEQVKKHGRPNDLIERLHQDTAFADVDFQAVLNPADYIGRAPQQVDDFLRDVVTPVKKRLRKYADIKPAQLHV